MARGSRCRKDQLLCYEMDGLSLRNCMSAQWDTLWLNATIATCDQSYGLVEEAAIATKHNKITWVGPMRDLRSNPEQLASHIYDVAGACITPGLIDCHTHLIYGGDRSHEFEMRLKGATYEEIIRSGGGIHSTVAATRLATEDELFIQSLARAKTMLANGVTTLEIKSGYGLDVATELKMLRVAKRIEEALPLTVSKTFLGAHTVPLDHKNHAERYIDLVCEEMLPQVAAEKLADAVDVFCERIAFNYAQTERVFKTAQQYGLTVKCHAEQLSDTGGAQLAAQYGALSVDHLEYLSLDGVNAISQSGSVAVLLPGAFYFLQEKQLPPIALLRQYGVPMAIATDCNPGTSPILSLLLIMNMACTLFKLTPEEALVAATLHAARALGLGKSHGSLVVGKIADFAVWNISHPTELSYYIGSNPLQTLIKNGKIISAEFFAT